MQTVVGGTQSWDLIAAALRDRGLAVLKQAHVALEEGSEGQEDRLAEAARLLWQAYSTGAKEPAVVWPLKHLWMETGHLDRVVVLLRSYLKVADDPDEWFLAGHHLVDTYALQGACQDAVEHHRRYVVELGATVPAWRRLWSLSDATVVACWKRCGQLDEWLSLSLRIFESVQPVDEDSRLAVAYYLRTLAPIRELQGRLDEAVACAEHILEIYAREESLDALRVRGDALDTLIHLYSVSGQTQHQTDATQQALQLAERLEVKVAEAERQSAALSVPYRQVSSTFYHNLACTLMWEGQYEEAVPLFEKSLSYSDNPLTQFFYAGVLLAARDDRAGALRSLRRAASDPRSSLIHRFEEAFRENECFLSAHDDPEFLAVVREGRERYKVVGS